jgi:vacuolar-type H+-ATPase subunit H
MVCNGGYMEEERTLLQQIRDKEQEFSKKIETVKQETDAQIAAARTEQERTIRDAERSGKIAADESYRKDREKTESEIGKMKKASVIETEAARVTGEKNLPPAVEKIVGYVTME